MDRLKSQEGEKKQRMRKSVIQCIFFVQSVCVLASGLIGILYYNSTSVETARLHQSSYLPAITAVFQLLAVSVCCIPKCKYDFDFKFLSFIVSWSCIWVLPTLIYSFVRVYDNEKGLTLVVSLILVFDTVYALLLFGAIFLIFTKICRAENRVEKSTQLIQNKVI